MGALWTTLAALLLALLSSAAQAGGPSSGTVGNPATQVPRVADGPGKKVGKNSTFHGGAALAIGFDSNVFSEASERSPRRAAFGLPSAWISIGNRPLRNGVLDSPPKASGRKADYHLALVGGYRLYMTRRPTVWQASKGNLGVNFRAMFAPGKRFSFGIDEDLYYIGEPTNFEALRYFNFNRIDHSAALRFILRPSGGRLAISAAYRNSALVFVPGGGATGEVTAYTQRSNRMVNGVETETRYRFRDRSAFAVRYQFHNTYYFCCTETGTGRNEDSDAHRLMGGFVGQLGKKVVLDVFAGWGWGLYKQDANGPDHKNFIGYAAVGWFPTSRTQLGLRLSRTFQDSLIGNYYTDTGGSLSASHTFRWKMRVDAGFGVYRRRYAGLPVPGNETDYVASYTAADGFLRRDTLIAPQVQIEQPFGKFFVLGFRYAAGIDLTDFAVTYENGFTQPGQFSRHLLMLFAAVRY